MDAEPARSDQLIQESIADPRRFEGLFELHFGAVHGYLRKRLGADEGADLAAEVFVRAFRDRATYRRGGPGVRAWLFGIALNLLLHRRRTEERRLRAYARAAAPQRDDTGTDDLVARLDASACGRDVAAALLELNEGEREVLLLAALAELSRDEIAAALGIAPGTVGSRLNRARGRLRPALAHLEPIAGEERQNG